MNLYLIVPGKPFLKFCFWS